MRSQANEDIPETMLGRSTNESDLLSRENWDEPLLQFSQSTGLSISLYDLNLKRVSGPHVSTPFGITLESCGAWGDRGCATLGDKALAEFVLRERKTLSGVGANCLALRALPAEVLGKIEGVFVFGWVFDHFADPVETDRLAKTLNVPAHELWQIVRQHAPTSSEKIERYTDLLGTIANSLMTELINGLAEKRNNLVLQILNESGRELSVASSYSAIAGILLEAAQTLLATRNLTVRFVNRVGEIDTSDATLTFTNTHELFDSRAVQYSRVVIEAADRSLLGVLEYEGTRGAEPSADLMTLLRQVAVAIQKVNLISRLEEQKLTLQVTLDDLRRANVVRDEFLATVSHELRNPLNAILGWCELLRSNMLDESKKDSALLTIERNAKVQAQLVADLLDVSRIISGKMRIELQQVDFIAVLNEALKTVRAAVEQKQMNVTLDLPVEAATVWADPLRLQQVIWNLLSNAIRYTQARGSISVTVMVTANAVDFTVRDNGSGISPEFLPHIFDRFSQQDSSTTRAEGGLGLGLAIVKQIVELHGGTISVASDGVGRGSAFQVRLPRQANLIAEESIATGSPAAPTLALRKEEPQKKETQPRTLSGRRILIVDDSPDSRNLMAIFVEKHGAEVRTAESPSAGLVIMQDWLPDLVVSDIAMPGEDGYDFIEKIRSLPAPQLASTPAIAVTAYAREEDKTRALTAGFQDHISKPINPTRLVEVAAELIRRMPRTLN